MERVDASPCAARKGIAPHGVLNYGKVRPLPTPTARSPAPSPSALTGPWPPPGSLAKLRTWAMYWANLSRYLRAASCTSPCSAQTCASSACSRRLQASPRGPGPRPLPPQPPRSPPRAPPPRPAPRAAPPRPRAGTSSPPRPPRPACASSSRRGTERPPPRARGSPWMRSVWRGLRGGSTRCRSPGASGGHCSGHRRRRAAQGSRQLAQKTWAHGARGGSRSTRPHSWHCRSRPAAAAKRARAKPMAGIGGQGPRRRSPPPPSTLVAAGSPPRQRSRCGRGARGEGGGVVVSEFGVKFSGSS